MDQGTDGVFTSSGESRGRTTAKDVPKRGRAVPVYILMGSSHCLTMQHPGQREAIRHTRSQTNLAVIQRKLDKPLWSPFSPSFTWCEDSDAESKGLSYAFDAKPSGSVVNRLV